jgi:soluble lytic murein transglycosylase-like protein
MPGTAARYGVDATELAENIEGGMRYLRDLSALFDGDPQLVAAGYNAGEGAVQKYANTIPPYRETRTYVRRVIEGMERYRSHACPVAGMRIARR